jgi:hypothetical protein
MQRNRVPVVANRGHRRRQRRGRVQHDEIAGIEKPRQLAKVRMHD